MPKLKYTEQRERWTWRERRQWTEHELETRRAWLVHRAQARYRKEEYELTWEQYVEAWGDQFDNKGRHPWNMTMIRRDPDQPWRLGNVEIINRRQHCQEQILKRIQQGLMRG